MNKFKISLVFLVGVVLVVLALRYGHVKSVKSEESSPDGEIVQIEKIELKIGSSGDSVLYLHEKIHEFLQLPETEELVEQDVFNEKTQYYVTLFQMTQGIEPDGVVSADTWSAFENSTAVSKDEIYYYSEFIPIDDGDENVSKEDDDQLQKSKKIAYLTFDDGPHPVYTQQIVALLEEYGAGATFFALGQEVDRYPDIVFDTSAGGGKVANHTYTHIDISKASNAVIKEEILKANQAIEKITKKTPICFRPPYGAINPDTKQKIDDIGGKTIMWDVDPQDWSRPGVDVIVDHVLTYTQDGEIILFHDGGGDRMQTVEALEEILSEMTKSGWEFRALGCVR